MLGCLAIPVQFDQRSCAKLVRLARVRRHRQLRMRQCLSGLSLLEQCEPEPEGEGGDAAREMLPKMVQRSHDEWCTVSRTVELGTTVTATVE